MERVLAAIREATRGTAYEGDLFLVGGFVRDELLGLPPKDDVDLVTRGDAPALARMLFEKGVSEIAPVTYERFGTAMILVQGVNVELITARRESYDAISRKPHVETASYEEDAQRRDITVNTLMRGLHDGELRDPLGLGLPDLEAKLLRTPIDPRQTFRDDPLRMLRVVRFRGKLGFAPAPGLYEAIREERERLDIVSRERIRDELVKMLAHPSGQDALEELRQLGLLERFAPELLPMVGCTQGHFHHLDVWHHSLLVMRQAGIGDLTLTLAALLHDVGKPATRFVDGEGHIRFFGHESVGAEIAATLLRRLKFSEAEIEDVVRLVRHHMRLGSSPEFSAAAARRLMRDLGDDVERLLALVEADASSLAPGVRALDLDPIRARLAEVQVATPREQLESPLSGQQIMAIRGLAPGPEVGRLKGALLELVLEGELAPGDVEGATERLKRGL
jgi:poly(A) polymerase